MKKRSKFQRQIEIMISSFGKGEVLCKYMYNLLLSFNR